MDTGVRDFHVGAIHGVLSISRTLPREISRWRGKMQKRVREGMLLRDVTKYLVILLGGALRHSFFLLSAVMKRG